MATAVAESQAPRAATPRRRQTRPIVHLVDRLTTLVITIGGVLVIVAVLGILVYLVSVVLPLFRPARVEARKQFALFSETAPTLLWFEADIYRTRGLFVEANGRAVLFDLTTGQRVAERSLLPPTASITAFARPLASDRVAFGLASGHVQMGRLRISGNSIEATLDEPVLLHRPNVPVVRLDYKHSERREVFTAMTAEGELFWDEVTRRVNVVTGKVTVRVAKHQLPYERAETLPEFLLQNAQGDQVFLAWRDGTLRRYDLRRISEPVAAEVTDLTPDGAELTNLRFMLGDQSLIATDSRGDVKAWFRVERPGAGTADGYVMVAAHDPENHRSHVTAVDISMRDKCFVTGTVDGELFLRHMTSDRVLLRERVPDGAAVRHVALMPRGDGMVALDAQGRCWVWHIHNPHPETTWRTLFGKVWYEGYNEPTYTWQSSSGTDDFEPKFSLVPLIFGTMKATVYSMMFAVPIALLAAIYTSQFLDKRLRPIIKSGIETMASLPSVVLGFVAALVLAPVVENWIVACLVVFALIPVVVLGAAFLWQMVPPRVTCRYQGWPQFVLLIGLVMVALWAARHVGPWLEVTMFAGDFKAWLDGRVGSPVPGLAAAAWPFAVAGVAWAQHSWWRRTALAAARSRAGMGLTELGRFVAVLILGTLLAYGLGHIMAAWGWDLRGWWLGTYVQRNTFVVGFVMGFAVIPIIYTISEDALSSVPEHLKSASLGCGATPWQTAVRVILPVALSGIFSAIMVGLGRAVGETMIVVMAAGNTPLMDWNIFNGLRALSANIAVELPEAVKDSTLYRVLFLAALTLFVITFVVNTIAEIIRQRFRRRAFQL